MCSRLSEGVWQHQATTFLFHYLRSNSELPGPQYYSHCHPISTWLQLSVTCMLNDIPKKLIPWHQIFHLECKVHCLSLHQCIPPLYFYVRANHSIFGSICKVPEKNCPYPVDNHHLMMLHYETNVNKEILNYHHIYLIGIYIYKKYLNMIKLKYLQINNIG